MTAPAMPRLDPRPARSLSPARELVTVVLGAWLVTGLFVDGWAHLRQRPESFFTPWHGLLYSGFLASAVWAVWLVGRSTGATRERSAPVGYRLGVAGVVVFGAGGVADMAWHQLFGIEVGLEALLSPSHLVLFAGGLLLLTSPLRSAWRLLPARPSFAELAPGLLSVAAVTAVVAFFLMYLSPFLSPSATRGPYREIERFVADEGLRSQLADDARIRGVASILVTTFLLLGPALFLLRRFRLPLGSLTLLFGSVGLMVAGLDGFDHLEGAVVTAAGGLAGDLVARRLRPDATRPWAFWALGAAVPLVLWGLYFAVLGASGELAWSVELWSGTTVLSAMAGLGLALLMVPPHGPGRTTDGGPPV